MITYGHCNPQCCLQLSQCNPEVNHVPFDLDSRSHQILKVIVEKDLCPVALNYKMRSTGGILCLMTAIVGVVSCYHCYLWYNPIPSDVMLLGGIIAIHRTHAVHISFVSDAMADSTRDEEIIIPGESAY